MESVESQIAEWRAYVAGAPGVNGRDVETSSRITSAARSPS